ncbi:zinc ribbon domain-containing protein [Cyanobacterium aponinum]|nr:zinc ribbon domain-containing protein [Cyanobacterium aponinum]
MFLEVNPKYSSQTCSHCGFKDKKIDIRKVSYV